MQSLHSHVTGDNFVHFAALFLKILSNIRYKYLLRKPYLAYRYGAIYATKLCLSILFYAYRFLLGPSQSWKKLALVCYM